MRAGSRRAEGKDSTDVVGDGRTLAYLDAGDPAWPSVFFLHGAPMSRLHLDYLEETFATERVRLVAPDRPAAEDLSPSRVVR